MAAAEHHRYQWQVIQLVLFYMLFNGIRNSLTKMIVVVCEWVKQSAEQNEVVYIWMIFYMRHLLEYVQSLIYNFFDLSLIDMISGSDQYA